MENIDKWQHIYLFMDDSGKISPFEDYAIFAGILFQDSKELSKFKNAFRSILKELSPKYRNKSSGGELKGSFIRNNDRRRIINFSKKFTTFGTVILNKNLNSNIIHDTRTKGRFTEYAQRRLIKNCINNLISVGKLNNCKPLKIQIIIDQMPTKTNGYYCLKDGLVEELRYGILNYNYGVEFPPIIHGDLEVDVKYRDSKLDLGIQMADIIANTIRKSFVVNPNWFESSEYLKKKVGLNIIVRLPN